MATSPIYLTEADVGRLVTEKDAIATLEALFATWGQPSTSNLPRQRARLAAAVLLLSVAPLPTDLRHRRIRRSPHRCYAQFTPPPSPFLPAQKPDLQIRPSRPSTHTAP